MASDAGSNGKNGQKERKQERLAWIALVALLGAGVLVIVLFTVIGKPVNMLVVELLVALASLVVGGFLGFLFGIPRAPTRTSNSAGASDAEVGTAAVSSSGYEPSNSLEQVADWLTKILVGVGLVELRDLKEELAHFGARLDSTLQVPGIGIVSQLVLITFFVLGLLASFLWTRIYYGAIQAVADFDVRSLLARLTATEKRAKTAEEVSTALATGELKPSVTAGRGAAIERAAKGEDPMLDLPAEVQERIQRLEAWSKFDYDSDPAADLFEGNGAEANGRRFDAEILANLKNRALHIKLRVSRLRGEPLDGAVIFLLHPTFGDRIETTWPENGVAELQIISEGVFTVVAIADRGSTILTYDLAKLPNVPKWFQEQ